MKRKFILLSCLLTTLSLQADVLSYGYCGCGKKKHQLQEQCSQEIHFNGGCGCGGGSGGGQSDELPPDNEE